MKAPTKTHLAALLSVLFLLMLLPIEGHGQPFRMGRIDTGDFIDGVYEKDPDASAVILYDYGRTTVDLDTRTGSFYYMYRKQVRIQILDERGLDWADYAISLYESGISRETMSGFNAYVHNLDGSRVRSTRIRGRAGMTEQTSDTRKTIKFSFPEVVPGSIIEVAYNIRSPFLYNLPTWQFQYGVPVEYSEYSLMVPEYYNYRIYMQGYEPLVVSEQKPSNTSYQLPGRRPADGTGVVTAQTTEYRWVMEDLPAMRAEPYTNSIRNYLSMIRFELSSIVFPGSAPERFVLNWSDVDQRLQESDAFGGFLSGSRQLRQEMRALEQLSGSQEEKIAAALAYIHENIRWNRSVGVFASGNPRQVLRQGEGNAAAVNLMLVAALRQLGMEADPVVSSTRTNGIVISAFPTISRYNYVLAAVKLENGQLLLLDATDPLCPPGMLPARALNGEGRIVGEDYGQWVELKPEYPSVEQKVFHLKLDAEGNFSGTMRIQNQDYAAYNVRRALEDETDMEKYRESFQAEFAGLQISSLEILNEKELDQPLVKNMEVTLTEVVSHTGDMIFFKPLLFESWETNPLRIEDRRYPVDFTYPFREEISMVIEIPEGFEVDFLPAAGQSSFRNHANFTFNTAINGDNQIEIQAILEVSKPVFLPGEYNALKEFFSRMVEKHNEQITLKAI